MPEWRHLTWAEPHPADPDLVGVHETRFGVVETVCRACGQVVVEARFRVEYAHHCACGERMRGWTIDPAAHEIEFQRWSRQHKGKGHGPVSPTANRKARRAKGMRP